MNDHDLRSESYIQTQRGRCEMRPLKNEDDKNARSSYRKLLTATILFMVWLPCIGGAVAQSFVSGSMGVDGPFDLTGTLAGTVVDFDPVVLGFDADQDGVYHFTTIIVPTDVTVRFQSDFSGSAPIIWLASDPVQIDGTLDLRGDNGNSAAGGFPVTPGPGGFHGGIGTIPPNASQPGFGPGAGPATTSNNSHGIGGGYATLGGSVKSGDPLGPTYGNLFLVPLLGGSGGSGALLSGTPEAVLAVLAVGRF